MFLFWCQALSMFSVLVSGTDRVFCSDFGHWSCFLFWFQALSVFSVLVSGTEHVFCSGFRH